MAVRDPPLTFFFMNCVLKNDSFVLELDLAM